MTRRSPTWIGRSFTALFVTLLVVSGCTRDRTDLEKSFLPVELIWTADATVPDSAPSAPSEPGRDRYGYLVNATVLADRGATLLVAGNEARRGFSGDLVTETDQRWVYSISSDGTVLNSINPLVGGSSGREIDGHQLWGGFGPADSARLFWTDRTEVVEVIFDPVIDGTIVEVLARDGAELLGFHLLDENGQTIAVQATGV